MLQSNRNLNSSRTAPNQGHRIVGKLQIWGLLKRNFAWWAAVGLIVFAVAACEQEPEQVVEAEKPAVAGVEEVETTETAKALLKHVGAPWTGDLPGMVERRMVRVLVPYNKAFFFLDKGQPKGMAYEALTRFEKFLNKKVKKASKGSKPARVKIVIVPTPREKLLSGLVEGHGDLAAGNLTITPKRREAVDFSDPFLKDVKEYLVTANSVPELDSVDALAGREVHVRESSSYYQSLVRLNKNFKEQGKPEVRIIKADEILADEDLLEMVNAEAMPAVIVDSHKAEFWTEIFDNIRIHKATTVRTGGEIAWAFRKDSPKLTEQVNAFVATIKIGTRLGSSIAAQYLKQQKWLQKLNDAEDRKKFLELVGLFQKYGERYDIDWVILAAKAYQESRFRQDVKGPTGAIGIMQIKPATARSEAVNIPNITALEDNIHAGTKYIRFLMDKYYPDLGEDHFNQTLLAFAGYNAGPNRIANLRKKANERGLDDTKWFNNVEWVVAESVGAITVNYVRNIFQYYVMYRNLYERHLKIKSVKAKE